MSKRANSRKVQSGVLAEYGAALSRLLRSQTSSAILLVLAASTLAAQETPTVPHIRISNLAHPSARTNRQGDESYAPTPASQRTGHLGDSRRHSTNRVYPSYFPFRQRTPIADTQSAEQRIRYSFEERGHAANRQAEGTKWGQDRQLQRTTYPDRVVSFEETGSGNRGKTTTWNAPSGISQQSYFPEIERRLTSPTIGKEAIQVQRRVQRDPLRSLDYSVQRAGHASLSRANEASRVLEPSGQPNWNAPVRISQLGIQPVPAPPNAGGPEIEPVLPPPANDFGDISQDDRRLPYQRLPDELIMRPPTPETKAEFDRFIPRIVDPQNTLNLLVNHPRILTFAEWAVDPKVRIYLPDETIARWDIISDTEVAIVGIAPGSTVLTVWFNDPTAKGGKRVLSYQVRVFEDPAFRESLEVIEDEVNDLFPDSHVRLSIVRDRLVVQGEAKDAIEAAQILSLLAQTRRGRRGPRRDGSDLREFRESQVFIDQDLFRLEDEAALRRSLLDPNALIDSGIVNLLRIPGEQQVMLRVSVAEINRSALRSIGADMQIGSGNVSFLSLVAETGFVGTPGFGNLLVNRPDFRLALRALRRVNLARVLAEPNLVALNGRTATFFAGDRVPLPAATAGFGGVGQGVRFDNVGVALNFTPFIVERNRIRLTVAGRVSTLDDAQPQANIGGTGVSAQNARTFQTTVDLRDGETMALAGLILTTMRSEATRVPLVGDLPLLGTLFSDKDNAYSEQELVILVTPELAHPLKACETPPLPGADVFEPTDVEFYLGNRLESLRTKDYRSTIRTDYARVRTGEDCFREPFIIGPSGHSYGRCNLQVQQTHGARIGVEPIPAPAPATRRPEPFNAQPLQD